VTLSTLSVSGEMILRKSRAATGRINLITSSYNYCAAALGHSRTVAFMGAAMPTHAAALFYYNYLSREARHRRTKSQKGPLEWRSQRSPAISPK